MKNEIGWIEGIIGFLVWIAIWIICAAIFRSGKQPPDTRDPGDFSDQGGGE